MQVDNLAPPAVPPGSPHQPKGQPSVVSLRSRGIPVLNLNRVLNCRRQARSAQQQALDTAFGFLVFCQLQSWLSVYTLLVTLVSSILFGFRDGVEVSWGWVLLCFAMLLPLLGIVVQGVQRRNEAVKEVAEVKSCCLSIYLANRDWPTKHNDEHLDSIRQIMKDLWEALHCYLHYSWFTTHHYPISMPKGDNLPKFLVVQSQEMIVHIRRIYSVMKTLSQACQKLSDQGVSRESIAHLHGSQRSLQRAICQLSHLKEYRTPQGLRSMARLYVVVVIPLFFAPMWAQVKQDVGYIFSLFLALMVHLLVVGLLNIGISLEDPFDDSALDGVSIYEASDQIAWAIQEDCLGASPPLSLKQVRLESPAANGGVAQSQELPDFENQPPDLKYTPTSNRSNKYVEKDELGS